jgi:hypothetical protein
MKNAEWEKLAVRLRSSGVVVYPVALGGELRKAGEIKAGKKLSDIDAQLRSGFADADRALREIAQMSGGLAFFPRVPAEFGRIYPRISAALRHEYSLGFAPPAHDARYHRLEVRLLDKNGRQLAPNAGHSAYQWRARPGYISPGP